MRDHPIAVIVLPTLAAVLGCKVSSQVHSRRVVPEEEGLARFYLFLHESERGRSDLLIDGLHAFNGQWTRVLNCLLAYPAKTWIVRRVILIRRQTMEDTAGPEPLLERRIRRIVGEFWFFFCVQVI